MTILLLIILFFNSSSMVCVASTSEIYARVMYDEVYLYKQAGDATSENIYFSLPKTYFVKLIDRYDDNFYLAEYKEFTGLVKRSEVKAVSQTPNKPYLEDTSFRVYSEQSQDLRTEPKIISTSSTIVTNIPLLSENLTYYGYIHGDSKIIGRTDIWYYCKYSGDKDYFGYVYSDFCDKFSPNNIPLNTENMNYIDNPTFEKLEKVYSTLPSKSNNIGIIVLILSFPAIIFLYMIMRNAKIFTKNEKQGEIQDY